ncbi:MAG: dihydrofolate reductase family protein, partial [Plesiomonas shigelloides]
SLNVRHADLPADIQAAYPSAALRQPLRVVVDSRNQVRPEHRLVQVDGEVCLARLAADTQAWPETVRQLTVPANREGKVDLVTLMMQLGRMQINQVWVEGGAQLAGALFAAGLVDELVLYLAPKLLGDSARGLIALPGLESLAQAPQFRFADVQQVGEDLRLIMLPQY